MKETQIHKESFLESHDIDESYTENSTGLITHTMNHNWRHDFREILGSLLGAGLRIEAFDESPYAEWRALPFLEETAHGWTMPANKPKIPLSFSVVARKKEQQRGCVIRTHPLLQAKAHRARNGDMGRMSSLTSPRRAR